MYFPPDLIRQIDVAVGTYFKGLTTKSAYVINFYFNKISDYTLDAVEHLILALIFYVILCIILYVIINKRNGVMFESSIEKPKRVLIVIAHPDDECMFFGPTIYKLTRDDQTQLYLLCLSTGAYHFATSLRIFNPVRSR